MAYVDREELYALWLAETLGPVDLGVNGVQLVEENPEAGLAPPTGPRGFIIRNWFGPFLLGPASSFLRGRC